VGKTIVIYVMFLQDVPCQKLFKSANVSRSYSKNNTGTVFLRHGVYAVSLLFSVPVLILTGMIYWCPGWVSQQSCII